VFCGVNWSRDDDIRRYPWLFDRRYRLDEIKIDLAYFQVGAALVDEISYESISLVTRQRSEDKRVDEFLRSLRLLECNPHVKK
jgi:hypothetical protein